MQLVLSHRCLKLRFLLLLPAWAAFSSLGVAEPPTRVPIETGDRLRSATARHKHDYGSDCNRDLEVTRWLNDRLLAFLLTESQLIQSGKQSNLDPSQYLPI